MNAPRPAPVAADQPRATVVASVSSAFDLEQELARRLLNLTGAIIALAVGGFLVANLLSRLWPEAALAALVLPGLWFGWRRAQASGRPVLGMRVLVWLTFIGLSGGLLRQGGTLGPAIWWLSALPVLLLQAGAVVDGIVMTVLIVLQANFVGALAAALGVPPVDPVALGAIRRDLAMAGALVVNALVLGLGIRWRRALMVELDAARVVAEAATSAKSRFLANMSHEVRTPLNGIVGATELLRGTRLDEGQRQIVGVLKRSSVALMALVNDVLDLSKLEAGRMRAERAEFDLHDAIHDAAEVFSAQAQAKDVELLSHCTADLPRRCVGDPARLRQILHNLVANAVKFTAAGEVRVYAAPEPGPDGSSWMRVSVRDTGIGMTEAQRTTLFEAFEQGDVTTTRRFGGSGLGLAISRELATLLGGRIEVESLPGRGSTFMLLLPLAAVVDAAPPSAADAPLDGIDVVLVVSNRSQCEDLLDVIESAGARARTIEALPVPPPAPGADGVPQVVVSDERALARAGLDALAWSEQLKAAGQRGVLLVGLSVGARGLPRGLLPLYKPALPARVIDTLRRALQPVPDDSARMDLDPLADARGGHVLLVEDNPVNQLVAQGLLERLGASVVVASGGHEALARYAEAVAAGTRYDLILMDCQMPDLDGLACTQRLRALEAERGWPRTPVVAMTAHSESEAGAECRAAGMDDFLPKPVELRQLAAVLTRWRSDVS